MDNGLSKTYRIKRMLRRGFTIAATVLFACMCLCGMLTVIASVDLQSVFFALALTGLMLSLNFFVICLWFAIYAQGIRAMVDEQGIVVDRPFRRRASLAWNEVVYLRERPVSGRLDLQNHDRTIALRLEYQLNEFVELRELILRRMAIKDPYDPAGMGFVSRNKDGDLVVETPWHRDPLALGIAAFMLLTSMFAPLPESIIFPIFFGGLLAINMWHRMTITPDEIRLHYLLRTRRIPFEQIQDVLLEDRRNAGDTFTSVRIIREDKKPIAIRHHRIGATALYNIIHDMWRQARSRSYSTLSADNESPRGGTT